MTPEQINQLKDLSAKIAQWGAEKGLNDLEKQRIKLVEEAGELAQGILKNNHAAICDGIGDCFVVMIQLMRISEIGINRIIKNVVSSDCEFLSIAEALEKVMPTHSIKTSIAALLYISQQKGVDFVQAVSDVYDIISKRKLKLVDGVLVRDEDKINQFEKLVRPVIKYLCENYHPHVTIVITPTNAELLEGKISTGQITDYIRD